MTVVRLERLTSRSWWLWVLATLVVVLLAMAWIAVTDPENRPWTLVGPLGALFAAYSVKRMAQWLEVDDGDTVLVQRRLLRTHRAGMRRARSISLRTNGGGAVQIVVEDDKGKVFAPLLMKSTYVTAAQPPQVLTPLLQAVEANRGRSSAEVAERLRAQIAHLQAGGEVATSPLAALARDYTAAVGAVGAAGGMSDPV
jgi:hypothetical protein